MKHAQIRKTTLPICVLFFSLLWQSCSNKKEIFEGNPTTIFYENYEQVALHKVERIMHPSGSLVLDSHLYRRVEINTLQDSIHVICTQENFSYWFKPDSVVNNLHHYSSNNHDPFNVVCSGIMSIDALSNQVNIKFSRGFRSHFTEYEFTFQK